MKGYIFEYYKYVRYPGRSLKDIGRALHYDKAEHSILTFGDFDRLTVNNIKAIDRYRDLSSLAKCWIGNRQSILLYSFSDETPFLYEDEDGQEEWGFRDAGTGEWDRHLFWALTELPFRNELREKMTDYEELLHEAQNLLHEMIQEQCRAGVIDCSYMLLGTLGTFGISILWFSNQYTDVLKVVNHIKSFSRFKGERMYLAAHTLFSQNPHYYKLEEDESLIKEIRGKVLVQITLKKGIDSSLGFIKKYESSVKHSCGEYDLMFEMDARDAFVEFERNHLFDHDTDEYQDNILQTKVILTENIENCVLEKTEEVQEKSQLVDDLITVERAYEELRKLIALKIDKTAGMIDTLDSLQCDYRYNVASAVNQNWADDFSYIFLRNLECIKDVIQLKKLQGEDIMIALRMVLNNLKQQIFHISEANSLNFETPKCHLRYTGQEDCILFAYMGIIKEILETTYKLRSYNKQSEIVPIVTVDMVPIIDSDLYFDKSSYVKETSDDQDFKILSLNLPHVTFYEIPFYIQYLYHEIYHYNVPEDREKRDYVMGILLTTLYLNTMSIKAFLDRSKWKEDQVVAVWRYISPLMYDIVIKNYVKLHMEITSFAGCTRKAETDKVLLIGKIYINKLIEYLISDNSCVTEWMAELNSGLQDKNNNISFEDMQVWLKKTFPEEKTSEMEEMLKDFLQNAGAGGIWHEKGIQAECVEGVMKIKDGLDEVSADIPMIELSKMPLEEYLLFYSYCLNNMLVKPSEICLTSEIKEIVRLGMILDFYKERGSSLETVKDKFTYLYIARYVNFSAESFDEVTVKFWKRKKEAEEWYNSVLKCRDIYDFDFILYKNLCHEFVEISCIESRLQDYDIDKKCSQYFSPYREAYRRFSDGIRNIEPLLHKGRQDGAAKKSCDELQEAFRKTVFSENIRLINLFQKQKKLTELQKINREYNKEKQKYEIYQSPELSWLIRFKEEGEAEEKKNVYISQEAHNIYGIEDFLKEMNSVTKQLESSCNSMFGRKYPLWYRGQSNSIFGLLPGAMRNDNLDRERFNYLAQYQRALFEEFKYRADGAPEIMDRSYYGISDYLALMQHYGVRTNLLDWSEDAFTSLYFALERTILDPEHQAESDAAIFVFSPYLYNEARKDMIREGGKATFCTEAVYLASKRTADGGEGLIPNIAASYNNEIYDMFLTGNPKYESENRYGYINEMELRGQEEMAYLPIAVYTSQLNPRIRSQSGIFLAYNLYAEPSRTLEPYAYMDLEKVQDYYLNEYKRQRKERFLYKVVIERETVKEVAECLMRMGISKERIYPELANIGERIK